MKHKLLLILLFSMNLLFAGNSDKPVLGPAIGLLMNGYFMDQNMVQFTFTIKNTGDQTLTNVYVTNTLFDSSNLIINYTQVPGTAIPSLAPGEENTIAFTAYKPVGSIDNCMDLSQALVHATKPDGNEITDLSDPYDYYLDGPSFTPFQYNMDFSIWHTYQDNNNNSVADVGDSIIYMYQLNWSNGFFQFGISDTNAVLDTSIGDTSMAWTANGSHNITQADVDLGYVFNGVEIMPYVACSYWISWNDYTLCTNCPTPTLPGNIIFTTKLTDLLPNTISGQVKFNSNNDNCATGTAFPNRMVITSDNTNSFATFTNSAGNYSILIPNVGNYDTAATASLNNNFSSNPVSIPVTSSGENVNYANTDFCISSATNYSNLSISMIPTDHARPGFDSHYRLYFSNNGSTALSGTLQMVFDETKASFISATPAQAAFALNTLTWNYTNLIPFEQRYIDITLNVFAPPTVNDGDVMHFSAVGNPIAGDAFPSDNMLMLDQNVVNAFDPNEKVVLEGAMIQPSQAADYLHYVTHFQNTGSASATTVVLKETLDADLDWSTFEPIGASHNYNIQIKNGNEITCTFNNIGLPDSTTNEAGSHGWLSYRIKPKTGFSNGDIANSQAAIYFDFNLPIVTNEVTTQLAPLAVRNFDQNNFAVFPNPAENYFIIKSNIADSSSYEVSDANGRILKRGITESGSQVDIRDFQKGYYFVTIRSGNSKSTYKIIKQ